MNLVGAQNYAALLTEPGLSRQDFMISLRNNFYYVIGVVPLQTVLALSLALIVNQRFLKGRILLPHRVLLPVGRRRRSRSRSSSCSCSPAPARSTSSCRSSASTGPLVLRPARPAPPRRCWLGLWTATARRRRWPTTQVLSLSLWEWLTGPSVAMSAIMLQVVWTTAGTFMLMFLAGLQDLPTEVEEAAMVDGANRWQRFRCVTLPHLRPTILLVLTLGLIGTWQVFDQIYVMTQGGPAKTTLTPAYLSYTAAFNQNQWGEGAAMAFLLFVLIFVLTERPAVLAARQGRRDASARPSAPSAGPRRRR